MSHTDHLVQHINHPELRSDSTLHVVAVVSNPARFHRRYALARKFVEEMRATPNVQLHLVEAAFGDRHHELEPDVFLRTRSEAWCKESMITVGERHLPRDWKYMAWVDADVTFRHPGWALETIHQLQHWPIVQPFQQCSDLGFAGDVMQLHSSFGWLQQSGVKMQRHAGEPYQYGHTGYAWACTRAFYERVGGLMDWAILGSADHHMAWSCIGQVDATVPRPLASYLELCEAWQAKAVGITHKQVGFTQGRIEHAFHGSKKKRFYRERWQILIDHKFDPKKDLIHDEQGLIQLVGKPDLEQALRVYNRSRMEDSIDA